MRQKTSSIGRRNSVCVEIFCLVLFALTVSACATVNTTDATLRLHPDRLMSQSEKEKQDRYVKEWNAGRFNLPMLPTKATAKDVARVTPIQLHLESLKPTNSKDKTRSSIVKVAITTQSGMVCTGTVGVSRQEYVVFGSWPWEIRWSKRSGSNYFWCPDNSAYFEFDILKNRGTIQLVIAGEGANTIGVINRTWDFKF